MGQRPAEPSGWASLRRELHTMQEFLHRLDANRRRSRELSAEILDLAARGWRSIVAAQLSLERLGLPPHRRRSDPRPRRFPLN